VKTPEPAVRLRRYPSGVASSAWPEAVQRVTSFLREARAEVRVEEFPEGTPTAKDAAQAVGCELGQIVKSLVFDCDGRKVLALVPGDRRADSEKVARAAGSKFARIAGSDEVRETTGFDPGAVAPFPLQQVAAIFIERTLLSQPVLWVGAGSERHMAALSPIELLRLSRARPMDVVEQAPYHSV
jgi:prolyl-tRNA editing enzyme YbaK/EbsC (Cys-tRNA(Pro) deacylase)